MSRSGAHRPQKAMDCPGRVNEDFTPWLDGVIKAVAVGQALAIVVAIFV
ncbi:hypothetical protein [Streptomyces sp. AC550_RSS872]|nr:hypothetical protein [Streptomyces sp. AC550_RSS872]